MAFDFLRERALNLTCDGSMLTGDWNRSWWRVDLPRTHRQVKRGGWLFFSFLSFSFFHLDEVHVCRPLFSLYIYIYIHVTCLFNFVWWRGYIIALVGLSSCDATFIAVPLWTGQPSLPLKRSGLRVSESLASFTTHRSMPRSLYS